MGRPYSERFLSYAGASTTVGYAVPPGWRVVVKFIGLTWAGAEGQSAVLQVAGVNAFYRSLPGATGALQFDVRYVAYGNEHLYLFTYGPDIRAHVSGYLFQDDENRATQLPSLPAHELPERPPELTPFPDAQALL